MTTQFYRIMSWLKAAAISVTIMFALVMFLPSQSGENNHTNIYASSDSFVASGRPDRNSGAATGIWIGQDIQGGYGDEVAFVQFGALPRNADERLVSAVLEVRLGNSTGSSAPLNVQAVLVTGIWGDDISWNKYQELINDGKIDYLTVSPEVPVDGTIDRVFLFDVTNLAVAWIADTQPPASFGFLLRPVSLPDFQVERAFWSRDCGSDCAPEEHPKLTLTYVKLDSALSSSPSGDVEESGLITYTLSLVNHSEFELSDLAIRATKPVGSRWPSSDQNGTIPNARVEENDIVWDTGLTLSQSEQKEFRYVVDFSVPSTPEVVTIVHTPITITGTYVPSDGLTATRKYTFTSRADIKLLKTADVTHVYLPLGATPK